MESFPVDVDPQQLVRWIVAEHAAAPSALKTTAWRVIQAREISSPGLSHLGDEEREDLSELATTAALEIAPAHEHDGWHLTVTVDDEIGPRELGDGAAVGMEQQMDLGTFYNEFIRTGRGIAEVVATVESETARTNLDRLLDAIERNQHPARRESA